MIVKFALKQPTGGFTREGNDLHYAVDISLVDALQQKPSQVRTLDGRLILIAPNEAITPQTRMIIEHEGMPASYTGNFLVDAQEQL